MDSLKELGRGIGQKVFRAWNNLSQGWRELIPRSTQALTRFTRTDMEADTQSGQGFPTWSLLAGEVIDKGSSIVVRLEVPGVEKDDLEISVREDSLYLRGERRLDREHVGGWYYVMERAYGCFQRVVPLPYRVDASKAQASLGNGVLTVSVPKIGNGGPRRLKVH